MRLFSWNITTRPWLIYSRLQPRQTETSTLSLRKPTISYDNDRTVCVVRHINALLKHDTFDFSLLYNAVSNSIMHRVIE